MDDGDGGGGDGCWLTAMDDPLLVTITVRPSLPFISAVITAID